MQPYLLHPALPIQDMSTAAVEAKVKIFIRLILQQFSIPGTTSCKSQNCCWAAVSGYSSTKCTRTCKKKHSVVCTADNSSS